MRRASLGTLLSGFVGLAVMMVGGVVVARRLGPENVGYLALLVLVPVVVAKIGGLGVPVAVTYHVARDPTAAAGIWARLRPVLIFQSGLLTGVHLLVLWALLADDPRYVTDAALYTVLLVPATLAQDYGLALVQARGRFSAYNVLRVAPIAIYAAGVTVLLVTDVHGLDQIAAVWAAANVALGVLTLTVGVSGIGPAGEDAQIPAVRQMISFGAKGVLGANSAIEYYRVDQAVVGLLLAPTALGLYSVGLAFTNLPRLVANSLGAVAYPHLAEQTDPAEARRKLRSFFVATVVACVAIVGVLEITAGWLVPLFFGEAFTESVPILRIVLVSALLIAARRVLADGARGLGLPALGTVAEVVSLLTLVPALVVFLPLWDLEGVAFSLVLAGVLGLLVMFGGLALASRRPAGGYRRSGEWSLPRARSRVARAAWAGVPVLVLGVDALAVELTVLPPEVAASLAAVLGFCLAVALSRRRLRLGG